MTERTLDRRSFLVASPAGGKQSSKPMREAIALTIAGGLEPYEPTPEAPWNRWRAAHLLRRTGFAASEAAIADLLTKTPSAAVAELMQAATTAALPTLPEWHNVPPPPANATDAEKRAYVQANNANKLAYRGDWFKQLHQVGLREKMVLFWSNHFVAELAGYGLAPYAVQYLTFLRENAFGNVRDLVRGVGLLPAMLLYLNGTQNRSSGPNENYARELLELFTMGITDSQGTANYTQNDITEIARALTGYQVDKYTLSSFLNSNRFDDGEKTFFGRTGSFGYDEVINILFEERSPQIASFICRKLYRFFVYAEPDEAIVSELANQLLSDDFELAGLIQTLLASAHFFDDQLIGSRIKSPVEYLLSLVKSGQIQIADNDKIYVRMWRWGDELGQRLLDPPNVAGWSEYHDWLSTGTIPLRWNYGIGMFRGQNEFDRHDPVQMVRNFTDPYDPYVLVRELANCFLSRELSDEAYADLAAVLLDGTPDYEWSLEASGAASRLSGFINYLLQLPEAQLC